MSTPPLYLLHAALVEFSAAPLLVVDQRHRVAFSNPAVRRLMGIYPVGRGFDNLIAPAGQATAAAFLRALLGSPAQTSTFMTCDLMHADGRMLPCEVQAVKLPDGSGVSGVAMTLVDVSSHRQALADLERSTVTDALTGLGSRAQFSKQLKLALRQSQDCVVGLLDVDQFKQINDMHGHDAGDVVLRALADHLLASLPTDAVVCRLGGDEFWFILRCPMTPECLSRVETLLSMEMPLGRVNPMAHTITSSIGLTTGQGGTDGAVLMEADVAMYTAKTRGRRQYAIFGNDVRRELDSYRSMNDRLSDLTETNQKLYLESRTDALTGLANRRAMAEFEELVVGNPGSRWSSCCVLFIDIDHFSQYNKIYTDVGGDLALQTVATALRQSARDADLVFRKGGEEFVAVLPQTDFAAAWHVAERMRSNVKALGILHRGGGSDGLLSVLVAVASVSAGCPVSSGIASAGNAAMRAKVEGRRARVVGMA